MKTVIYPQPTLENAEAFRDLAEADLVLHLAVERISPTGAAFLEIHVLRSKFGDSFVSRTAIDLNYRDPARDEADAKTRDAEVAAALEVLRRHHVALNEFPSAPQIVDGAKL